jgi:GH25 family lysozyme M1 (1,4-beta-N-acetylmuramidase)
MHGPAGDCVVTHLQCQVYNHAANNVLDALAYARSQGADPLLWWLDVEVTNHWTYLPDLNELTVRAATETLQKEGRVIGIYSVPQMWLRITGGAQNGLPVWIAGAPTDAVAPSWCTPAKSFTGGEVWLVQSVPTQFDVNFACDPMVAHAAETLRFG